MTKFASPSVRTFRKLSTTRITVICISIGALLCVGQQFFTSSASSRIAKNTGSKHESSSSVSEHSVFPSAVCTADPIVINNTDGGPGSLRQAIVDACDASTITFNMASVTSPVSLTSAELIINKNLTIVGPGLNSLTIERSTAPATPRFRIFTINPGVAVSISGLTISKGRTPDTNGCGGTFFDGGGIHNEGTLTLTSVAVASNASGDCTNTPSTNFSPKGGGIANFGTLTITDSLVNGNTTGMGPATGFGGYGGGIFNSGTLAINNTSISSNSTGAGRAGDNVSFGGFGGNGGGIYNTGKLSMTHCDVSQNTTGRGGNGGIQGAGGGGSGAGIFIWASSGANTVTIDASTVSDNHAGDSGESTAGTPAGGDGGGIRVQAGEVTITNTVISGNRTGVGFLGHNGFGGGLLSFNGVITVSGSAISNNTGAMQGGGIYSAGPSWLSLTNSTISGNQSISSGAGIFDNDLAKLVLINCTVTNNASAANVGNGVAAATSATSSQDSIANTIIAGNGTAVGDADVSGMFTSLGHNLIGNGDGSSGFIGSGDLIGATGTPVTARLGPLANNGGPTQTHALLENSPALDAGDNSLVVTPPFPATVPITDQRGTGFTRVLDGPDANATQTVDIGAFELQLWIENVPDKSTNVNTQLQFSFNVGDASAITSVTATSSNATLVPNNVVNLAVAGSGSIRTLTINPANNQVGTSIITITVNGPNSQSANDTFVLTVNGAPSDIALSNATVPDNSGSGVVVGTFSTTDPNPGDTFTYGLVSGAGDVSNASFTINGNQLLTNETFDFESKSSYSIRVRSTDQAALFVAKQFTITVSDGPDVPGAISFTSANFSVAEDAGNATITLSRAGGSDNQIFGRVGLTDLTTLPADYIYAPGSLDSTFNTGTGATSRSSSLPQAVQTVALQPDGKVVIGGAFLFYNGVTRTRIARINSNGSLDNSFNPGTGADNLVWCSAIQPDGKILIGGFFNFYNGTPRVRIARLNTDGSLDSSFQSGVPNDVVRAIVVQPDGKILIAGDFSFYGASSRNYVARLNSNGTLDSSFVPPAGSNSAAVAIALQPDGKVLVGGGFTTFGTATNTRLVRLNDNGTLDGSFSSALGTSLAVRRIKLQSDNKILVGGEFIGIDTPFGKRGIARLETTGAADASFDPGLGTDGGTVEDFVLQPDSKIVIAGWFNSFNGTPRSKIARLSSNGALDTSFNPGAGGNSPVFAIAFQPDGKLVMGGLYTFYDGISSNGITRINGDLFVNWAPGDTSNKTVTLPIVDDSLDEANETLSLAITTVSGGATTGAIPNSVLTIIDNDPSPTAISGVSGSGVYGGTASVTATLSSNGSPLSGKTISFTLNGAPLADVITDSNGVATISGASLLGVNAATYPNAVLAAFAGDGIDYSSSNGQGPLTVNKASSTTVVTVSNAGYDGSPHGGSAVVTGAGGLNQPITVSYSGHNATVYGPSTTPPTNVGDYFATAVYAGDSNHTGSNDSLGYVIFKAHQTITVNTHAPANSIFGNSFSVAATVSSGLAVSFSSAGACTNVGSTFTMTSGTGTCTVKYDQAGDNNHDIAPQITENVTAQKATQSIDFSALSAKVFGDTDFGISASATSNLTVTFTASGQCTITGQTVHLSGVGSCSVTAQQSGNSHYNAATDVSQSFNITKGVATVAVASSVNPSEFNQQVTFTATVSSNAGTPTGSVQFKDGGVNIGSVQQPTTGMAQISTSSLSSGTHTVTVDYSGDSNFQAGTGTLAGGQVVKVQPTVSINDVSIDEGNGGTTNLAFTVILSAVSNLPVSVNYSTADGTATIADNDYQNATGTIAINPGQLSATINVPIVGDQKSEPDETLFVNLTNPSNAALLDSQAIGTITNDDHLLLVLEELAPNPNQAAAFESIFFVRDPFHVLSVAQWLNLGSDRNTRVILFASNLQLAQGEAASAVTVSLVDGNSQTFDVAAESVQSIPNTDLTQVIFRLPDALATGACSVTIKAHNQISNTGVIRIN